jgi:hypothetical protein
VIGPADRVDAGEAWVGVLRASIAWQDAGCPGLAPNLTPPAQSAPEPRRTTGLTLDTISLWSDASDEERERAVAEWRDEWQRTCKRGLVVDVHALLDAMDARVELLERRLERRR